MSSLSMAMPIARGSATENVSAPRSSRFAELRAIVAEYKESAQYVRSNHHFPKTFIQHGFWCTNDRDYRKKKFRNAVKQHKDTGEIETGTKRTLEPIFDVEFHKNAGFAL